MQDHQFVEGMSPGVCARCGYGYVTHPPLEGRVHRVQQRYLELSKSTPLQRALARQRGIVIVKSKTKERGYGS